MHSIELSISMITEEVADNMVVANRKYIEEVMENEEEEDEAEVNFLS